MRPVTVLLPEEVLEGLHELIRLKMYPDRSECIRTAIRDLLNKEFGVFTARTIK